MDATDITTAPFTTIAGYNAAREELRRAYADHHGVPVDHVRIAPGVAVLHVRIGGRFVPHSRDVVAAHHDRVRMGGTFRLTV